MERVFRFYRRIIFSYKQSSIMSDWKTYMLFDLIPPILQTLFFSMVAVLFLSSFVAMSFGYVFSCFILITSETNLVLNLVGRLLLIFTGANFPISKLPSFLQWFSNLLPLTRSIQIAQGLVEGTKFSKYYGLVYEELLLGCSFIVIAIFILKIMERKSRTTGKMEVT